MIDRAFLQRIGLDEDQTILLLDSLKKENRYRQLLMQEGVSPSAVEPVIQATKLEDVDFGNESLLREKVRAEWDGLITKKCQK